MKMFGLALGFVSTLALAQREPMKVDWTYSTAPCTKEGCVIERPESRADQINVYLKEFNDTFGRVALLLEQDSSDNLLYPQLILSRYGDVPEIENCPSEGEFCAAAVIARVDSPRGYSIADLIERPLSLGIQSHDSDEFGFWIGISAIDEGSTINVTLTIAALEKQGEAWFRTDILAEKSRSMPFVR